MSEAVSNVLFPPSVSSGSGGGGSSSAYSSERKDRESDSAVEDGSKVNILFLSTYWF